MKFPKSFTRVVGGEGKALGSDEEPGAGTALLAADNVLVSRQFNSNAWPVQRVVVAWYGPGEKRCEPMVVQAYVYDHATDFWFATGAEKEVPEGQMVTFDMPALIDTPNAGSGGLIDGPQPLEVAIVPHGGAKFPKGTYTFVVGADCSNSP
jgi:hypothetical protein